MVMDMDKVTFLDGFRTFVHKFNGNCRALGQSPLKTFLGVMHSVTDISASEQKENYTLKNKEWDMGTRNGQNKTLLELYGVYSLKPSLIINTLIRSSYLSRILAI